MSANSKKKTQASSQKSEVKLLTAPTYKYYVAYLYEHKTGFGFGGGVYNTDWPVNNWDRIKALASFIADENKIPGKVILQNWILL